MALPTFARVLCAVHVILAAVTCLAAPDEWKAGAASVAITPGKPLWLTGFAARTHAADATLHDLHVKALALEDPTGHRAVLVTSDLLGYPAPVADAICAEITRLHHVPRDRILLNASHTHGGPSLASPVHFIYGPRATTQQSQDIDAYTRDLEAKVVGVVGAAVGNLRPAHLGYATSEAGFAVCRRKMGPKGIQSFVPNPDQPIDRTVPVLRVESAAGELTAVVFGYAAHPTTITGGKMYYAYSGDYPAFAQAAIEKAHPGAVALFVEGCAGDVMVYPRGTVELAEKYGDQLAAAVDTALAAPSQQLHGPLTSEYETFPIPFGPIPTREQFEKRLTTGDLDHRWHARQMLAKLDHDGALPTAYPAYPIQVWQFGHDLTLVAMGGETCSGYGLRLKKELAPATVWVAGYSNDLCSYIPTRRIVLEGGYEGDRSQIYYMHPAPYAPTIEETIVAKAHELVDRARQP